MTSPNKSELWNWWQRKKFGLPEEEKVTSPKVGYFKNPEDKKPFFDPGIDGVPCPICGCGLMRFDLKTISVADTGRTVSLFYRTHKSCYDELSTEQQLALDSAVTGIGINP